MKVDSLRAAFERVAEAALEEDLGGTVDAGRDVTSVTTVPAALDGSGIVIAKASGVVCGLEAVAATYALLGPDISVENVAADGDEVEPGAALARVTGSVRALLCGERTALNVIGRLSGIATQTRAFVRQTGGRVELTDSRKTTPGLRELERYAVRTGGGRNHRWGLHDAVLIKDNHVVAVGSAGEAVRRAKAGTRLVVEVECETEEQVLEALAAGADAILLDNRDVDELRTLVARIRTERPSVFIEASGGVAVDTVAEISSTGVDRISVGALTHSVRALDVSFELERVWEA